MRRCSRKQSGEKLPIKSEFLLYQTEDGQTRIEVRLENQTVWLNQAAMVELFQTTKQNVSLHLQNIYEEGELIREATVKECLTVRKEEKRQVKRSVEFYSLDANMGLTTWKGAGRGRVLTKTDIGIAKNYLNRQEVGMLELLVGQYLDLAEVQARQRKVMTMKDWIAKLDAFLMLNNQKILAHAGSISADVAADIVDAEYEKFSKNRRQIDADHADEELRDTVRRLTEGKTETE